MRRVEKAVGQDEAFSTYVMVRICSLNIYMGHKMNYVKDKYNNSIV